MTKWRAVWYYLLMYLIGGPMLIATMFPVTSVLDYAAAWTALVLIFSPAAMIGASAHLLILSLDTRWSWYWQSLFGGIIGGLAFAFVVFLTFVLNPSLALLFTEGWRVLVGALLTGIAIGGPNSYFSPEPERKPDGVAIA
jgi:hypothetical protein